jgi:DNA-binding transcriptional LysR family regulator
VKIGCAFGAMPEIAGDLIFSFQQEYPQFKPEVLESADVMCDQAVENETVEIAFGLWPLNQKKFVSHLLFSQPMCLLVHKSHPLAKEESVSVNMLRSKPIMLMDENSKTNAIVKDVCRREGFEPSIFYLAAEVIAIHRLVNMNKGIGVSVLSVAKSLQQPEVCAIPFREQDLRWDVYLMKKRGATLSPGAQTFERYVLRKTRKNQQPGPEDTPAC